LGFFICWHSTIDDQLWKIKKMLNNERSYTFCSNPPFMIWESHWTFWYETSPRFFLRSPARFTDPVPIHVPFHNQLQEWFTRRLSTVGGSKHCTHPIHQFLCKRRIEGRSCGDTLRYNCLNWELSAKNRLIQTCQ
jgi:hypothetical protein